MIDNTHSYQSNCLRSVTISVHYRTCFLKNIERCIKEIKPEAK